MRKLEAFAALARESGFKGALMASEPWIWRNWFSGLDVLCSDMFWSFFLFTCFTLPVLNHCLMMPLKTFFCFQFFDCLVHSSVLRYVGNLFWHPLSSPIMGSLERYGLGFRQCFDVILEHFWVRRKWRCPPTWWMPASYGHVLELRKTWKQSDSSVEILSIFGDFEVAELHPENIQEFKMSKSTPWRSFHRVDRKWLSQRLEEQNGKMVHFFKSIVDRRSQALGYSTFGAGGFFGDSEKAGHVANERRVFVIRFLEN